MGLSSWILTFGSALPCGKMAKFSLGKVTVKGEFESFYVTIDHFMSIRGQISNTNYEKSLKLKIISDHWVAPK